MVVEGFDNIVGAAAPNVVASDVGAIVVVAVGLYVDCKWE